MGTCIWPFVYILSLRLSPTLVLNNPNKYLGIHGCIPYLPWVLSCLLLASIGQTLLLKTSTYVKILGNKISTPLSSFTCQRVCLPRTDCTYLWWNHYFSGLLRIWGKLVGHWAEIHIKIYVISSIITSLPSIAQCI